MSDSNVIQFVPKANPNRLSLIEADEVKAIDFLLSAPALMGAPDYSPSDYTAPTDDCA